MLRDRDDVQHSNSFRTKREAVDYEAQDRPPQRRQLHVTPGERHDRRGARPALAGIGEQAGVEPGA